MKTSNKRELYIKRIKYLLSTNYKDLGEDDRVNRILIKIILDMNEYQLLELWHMNKWSTEKVSKLMGIQSKRELENNLSKIITKLKPIVWNFKNNPFITDEDRKKLINTNWIGDLIIEKFLGQDLVIMPIDEYLNSIS